MTDISKEAIQEACNFLDEEANALGYPAHKYATLLRALAARLQELEAQKDAADARRNAISKIILKFKNWVIETSAGLEDEGDRVYLRSTNDADRMRKIASEFDAHSWDELLGHAQAYDFPARVAELIQENGKLSDDCATAYDRGKQEAMQRVVKPLEWAETEALELEDGFKVCLGPYAVRLWNGKLGARLDYSGSPIFVDAKANGLSKTIKEKAQEHHNETVLGYLTTPPSDAIAEAVKAEREACAETGKIVARERSLYVIHGAILCSGEMSTQEAMGDADGVGHQVSAAIRARGNT